MHKHLHIQCLLLTLLALPILSAPELSPPKLVRTFTPLSIRGLNYYPRETPWGGMWTKTPMDVWEKDMALAASLGANTVRTFLSIGPNLEKPGLWQNGTFSPAYHAKIDQLLTVAWQHGIRVILCLEFEPRLFTTGEAKASWKPAFTTIVSTYRNDGRVLLWDLMNEPDDESKWNEGTRTYLREALPLAHQLDTRHLTTIGITWQIDRLKTVGIPDVLQYHEYCPKVQLFEKGPPRVGQTIANQRRTGGARPLLIGEFGMSTARDPKFGTEASLQSKMSDAPGTEADQAKLYNIVLTAAEKEQVAGVLAWCLHDYPIKNPNESHFGIVRANGTLKPAAEVLRQFYTHWSHDK